MSDAPQNDESKDPFLGAEMTDRAEKRERLKKARVEKEKDEVELALARGRLAEAKKAQRKKYIKFGAIAVGVGLLSWAGYFLFAPYEAGPPFGICKVYLENTVRYPQELRLSMVEDLRPINSTDSLGGVRIWYTQIDAGGSYRMESIECYYRQDPELGAQVDRININRRPVEPEKIKKLNNILSVILKNMPDLTYPPAFSDSLSGLQINTDSIRMQLGITKR